jgi:hypothetical protein
MSGIFFAVRTFRLPLSTFIVLSASNSTSFACSFSVVLFRQMTSHALTPQPRPSTTQLAFTLSFLTVLGVSFPVSLTPAMNTPPPPPTKAAEIEVHISRDGEVIGSWPLSLIRPMLVNGDLKPTDHSWAEGHAEWTPLVPPAPGGATPFPYLANELPVYWIRNGYIYGPRTLDELDALYEADWLDEETPVFILNYEEWTTLGELVAAGAEPQDWINHGFRALNGDTRSISALLGGALDLSSALLNAPKKK